MVAWIQVKDRLRDCNETIELTQEEVDAILKHMKYLIAEVAKADDDEREKNPCSKCAGEGKCLQVGYDGLEDVDTCRACCGSGYRIDELVFRNRDLSDTVIQLARQLDDKELIIMGLRARLEDKDDT